MQIRVKRPNLHLKEHVSDLLNVFPEGVEKEVPKPTNSTVSRGPLDSQNSSQKENEKENDQDQSANRCFSKLMKFSANCHLASDWSHFAEHKL